MHAAELHAQSLMCGHIKGLEVERRGGGCRKAGCGWLLAAAGGPPGLAAQWLRVGS